MKIETEEGLRSAKEKADFLSDLLLVQASNFGLSVLLSVLYGVGCIWFVSAASKDFSFDWLYVLLIAGVTISPIRIIIALYRLGLRPIHVIPCSLIGLFACLFYWSCILCLPFLIDWGLMQLVALIVGTSKGLFAGILMLTSVLLYPVVQLVLVIVRAIRLPLLRRAISEFEIAQKTKAVFAEAEPIEDFVGENIN